MFKQVESSRMSWCLADVLNVHGDVGLSGGNGLWGPAKSSMIFPDEQPTVLDDRSRPYAGALTQPGAMDGMIIDDRSIEGMPMGPSMVNPPLSQGSDERPIRGASEMDLGNLPTTQPRTQPVGFQRPVK